MRKLPYSPYKLDIYVLKNFLTLFFGTFVITIFILMMQFMWKYVDDIVGKGLDWDVILKLFFYAGETLVSLALPLAILLASLISFGNMGERLELLAMKAAGIPLIRVMRPVAILMAMMAGMSYYFQDITAPNAQNKLYQMMYSVRETSPTIEIPEGVFYNGIADINLYVQRKDEATNMLYEVIVFYNPPDHIGQGFMNSILIVADSAKLEIPSDNKHVMVTFYHGNEFEKMQSNAVGTSNYPFRRERFVTKQVVIDFNTDFSMTDNDFSNNAKTKPTTKLIEGVDSLELLIDSTALGYYDDMKSGTLRVHGFTRMNYNFTNGSNSLYNQPMLPDLHLDTLNRHLSPDSIKKLEKNLEVRRKEAWQKYNEQQAEYAKEKQKLISERDTLRRLNVDSLYNAMTDGQKADVAQKALSKVKFEKECLAMNTTEMKALNKNVRQHRVQIWQKATLALACVIFFFIGAPLGAIIRKGGMGMPVVVAVVIFLIYYIINSLGTNLATAGTIPVWLGVWFSSMILAPIAYYLTVKSNNDSTVFNIDTYTTFFKKLMGKKDVRHITRKEVIINDPDYEQMSEVMKQVSDRARQLRSTLHLNRFPNYLKLFFGTPQDDGMEHFGDVLDKAVDVLHNSKDKYVLNMLNQLPIIDPYAHVAPFRKPLWNKVVGIVFPVGIILLFRISRFRRRLSHELRDIANVGKQLAEKCEELSES